VSHNINNYLSLYNPCLYIFSMFSNKYIHSIKVYANNSFTMVIYLKAKRMSWKLLYVIVGKTLFYLLVRSKSPVNAVKHNRNCKNNPEGLIYIELWRYDNEYAQPKVEKNHCCTKNGKHSFSKLFTIHYSRFIEPQMYG
jgi:hypothetical protein